MKLGNVPAYLVNNQLSWGIPVNLLPRCLIDQKKAACTNRVDVLQEASSRDRALSARSLTLALQASALDVALYLMIQGLSFTSSDLELASEESKNMLKRHGFI